MKVRRNRSADSPVDPEQLARALADDDGTTNRARAAGVLRELSRQARIAGSKAVVSGRWLTDTTLGLAAHLPVRDRATLEAHHGGKTGPELADALIRNAGRTSGAIGAAAGALIGAEEVLPPSWVTVPFELAAETALVVALEMKLVSELHEALDRPVPAVGAQRGLLVAQSWAEKRGVNPQDLLLGVGAADIFGRQARTTLTIALRRRMTRRMGRSMAALIPLMAGAIAGAVLNRRATVAIGQTIAADIVHQGAAPGRVVPLIA